MGAEPQELDYPKEFVEVDPTGRYGRYNEMLGKGASKIVYRAFDEYEGIEVAWNQVKLHHFLQSPDDLERLYCEIHLLKTLKHENIMKFYTSWVDVTERNINFVTEMFTSGTLRQYRQKHRRVNIRAVKHWCRQILKGLVYLHSHDPPVIHRDLKCDNIFINGNQGEVKIGDLGLAAILRNSHAVHCVGTPEFMAPEVYQEEYNELVDIYSFGMCILEMVTFEYPYSECTRPVQIYKKVMSGTKPEALYRVNDLEVRQFVEKCLATVSQRLTAKELLTDRFLQIDDCGSGCWEGGIIGMSNLLRLPSYSSCYSNGSLITNGFFEDFPNETNKEGEQNFNAYNIEGHGIKLFNSPGDEPFTMDITIKGTKKEDGGIFLRLRIIDTEGRARNIYFPFDIEADTAVGVAMEMVAELEITDHEVTRIAELIDGQVLSLAPRWESTLGKEEMSAFPITDFCDNCTSNASSCVSLLDYVSGNKLSSSNLQACHSSQLKCPAMHGRFGEVMYQDKGPEQSQLLSRSQLDVLDLSSRISGDSHFDEELSDLDQTVDDKTVVIHMNDDNPTNPRKFLDRRECLENRPNDYENEIRQELRLLKAKYQAEHRDCSNQHLEGMTALNPSPESEKGEFRVKDKASVTAASKPLETMKSFHFGRHFSFRLPPHRATSPTMENKSAYSSNGYSHNGHPDMDGQRDLDCD